MENILFAFFVLLLLIGLVLFIFWGLKWIGSYSPVNKEHKERLRIENERLRLENEYQKAQIEQMKKQNGSNPNQYNG